MKFIFLYFVLIKDQKSQAYLIGSIGVSGKTKWDVLDGVIRRLFKVSCNRLPGVNFHGFTFSCLIIIAQMHLLSSPPFQTRKHSLIMLFNINSSCITHV